VSKASIRSRMPTVAAIFDEVRAQFPEAKLLYGKEGAHEIDARQPESNVFDIPPGYRKPCEPTKKGGR
jgi:hypothetical protein